MSIISDSLRTQVANLAIFCCEYCLMHERDMIMGAHIDHIISIKHGGRTIISNLAFSCVSCNVNKGSDIATVLLPKTDLVPFFNPRVNNWSAHFRYEEGSIIPLNDIGSATEKILQFNTIERVQRRMLLHTSGRYPGRKL